MGGSISGGGGSMVGSMTGASLGGGGVICGSISGGEPGGGDPGGASISGPISGGAGGGSSTGGTGVKFGPGFPIPGLVSGGDSIGFGDSTADWAEFWL